MSTSDMMLNWPRYENPWRAKKPYDDSDKYVSSLQSTASHINPVKNNTLLIYVNVNAQFTGSKIYFTESSRQIVIRQEAIWSATLCRSNAISMLASFKK